MSYLKPNEIVLTYESTQHRRVKTCIHSANVYQCGYGPGSLEAPGGRGVRQVNGPPSMSLGCLKLVEEVSQQVCVAGAVIDGSTEDWGSPCAGHPAQV